ncbi:hypothetical protein CRENBAI_008222 [Crenichthys baileyi]|uniref:Uncharacterized protein n=1 Tax=Crenichthys baileyi TaxID=28760 RepID=A0AAV9R0W3_9TELE
MSLEDLEKTYDPVTRGILWGVLWEYGESGLGISGSHLCFSQMLWFCWLLQAPTSSVRLPGRLHASPLWRDLKVLFGPLGSPNSQTGCHPHCDFTASQTC